MPELASSVMLPGNSCRENDYRTRQHLELNLICGKDAASTPELVSYGDGKLMLRWETPSACESALEGGGDNIPGNEGSGGSARGGRGFFHYVFLTFWLSLIGLFFYFAVGKFYELLRSTQRVLVAKA